ncbi:hypothetical protein DTO96_102401 [Ephemeroptericola cinctiostellae]|uniref:Prophage minor tail protein Z (GPZ) n=1 Tax=Ephemeroptericola cinctiostellae TaxID=2268024 RepID=A0A345DE58_9BURK|nr:hypothetical protein [Ephemeroptericola cinctiostellae]AXF86646.1 hypothetical protein DTO96_102401 [Ephemeroptericola cinctiostellae]
MSVDLEVKINEADLADLMRTLSSMPHACERAARRAMLRCARKMSSETTKNMSQSLKIARAVMRSRLRIYRKNEGMAQKVWLGMNAIAVSRLGKATQQRNGVQVGGEFYPKAFMIKKRGQAVYIRHGQGRWNFGYLVKEISEEAEDALMRAYGQADQWLMDILAHEIEFELGKL